MVLPMSTSNLRVRFAPSPTGFLHVGGARTALFNWLHARHEGGAFLLRIEDTDRERSSDEHTRVILDGLRWLGLDWDEDVAFQSQFADRHRTLAHRLVDEGNAYEDQGAIRFRMPEGEIAWEDRVKGRIAFQSPDLGDWVILRSDGSPTYNFTAVADDVEMGITLVMRGDDHVSNTPKQIAVYRALGREPPAFAHVPNIHGPDGKKLSKRHGATAVGEYRTMGILPDAMRNFLALLGWNPGDERELFFDIADLIGAFTIERIQKKSAIFDVQKLEWMNGQYVSRMPAERLWELVSPMVRDRLGTEEAAPAQLDGRVVRIIDATKERARTTTHLAEQVALRLHAGLLRLDEKAEKAVAKDREAFRAALDWALECLAAVGDAEWEPEHLERVLRALAEEKAVGPGKVFQPIRMAITGQTVSEPVNVLLAGVGKADSLARIRAARDW
jgi:glutamyl-tRNA synthetase